MSEATPALPWATTKDNNREENVTDERIVESELQPVSLQQLGLQRGARLEVLWQVTTDDGDATSRWFAGSITSRSPSGEATAGQPASTCGSRHQHSCTISYDGNEDFPEEMSEVLLLADHELYDMARCDTLWWRREGDAWEPPEEGDGEEEDEDEEAEGDDLEADATACQEVLGAAVEAALRERLSAVTGSSRQKEAVVEGYRDFMANLKEFIKAKAQLSDSPDVVITADDVAEFKAMMNTQLRTAHAHKR